MPSQLVLAASRGRGEAGHGRRDRRTWLRRTIELAESGRPEEHGREDEAEDAEMLSGDAGHGREDAETLAVGSRPPTAPQPSSPPSPHQQLLRPCCS